MKSRISDKTRLKKRRGLGTGKNYLPWIQVQDFSSRGLSSRILGRKTGRAHHLLSRLEANLFYILDYSQSVEDIREQYPLDLSVTKQIANSLSIKHPDDGVVQKVMTTDFFVVIKDGCLAISAKYAKDLTARTLQKLEIERQYWEIRNTPWYLITENELPNILVENVLQLRDSNLRPRTKVTDAELLDYLATSNGCIQESLQSFASQKKESFADLKKLFFFLTNSKQISFDITSKNMMELNSLDYAVTI